MKFLKRNIKFFVGIIIGALVAGGIGAYATYNYWASEIKYTRNGTEMKVSEALNDLYANRNIIYETGEFSQYLDSSAKYTSVTVTLQKTYTANDHARMIIVNKSAPNGEGAVYISYSQNKEIIGNTITFDLVDVSWLSQYNQTHTFEYAIVKYDNE